VRPTTFVPFWAFPINRPEKSMNPP
jgi:hypothetical protein